MAEEVTEDVLARLDKVERDLRELRAVIMDKLCGAWLPDVNLSLSEIRRDLEALRSYSPGRSRRAPGPAPVPESEGDPEEPSPPPEFIKPKQRRRKYKHRGIEDYRKVMEKIRAGASLNQTAVLLDMPYSTVHFLSRLTPEQAELITSGKGRRPRRGTGEGEAVVELSPSSPG
jgi:hypothetical protein